jgi:hypothetical protein
MIIGLYSSIIDPLWYTVKFAEGKYKLEFCLVSILRTCEFNRKLSLLLLINKSNEYIYCD